MNFIVTQGVDRKKVGKHETYLDAVHAALDAAGKKKGVACYVEDEAGNIAYETMASAGEVRREMGGGRSSGRSGEEQQKAPDRAGQPPQKSRQSRPKLKSDASGRGAKRKPARR